MPSDLETCRRRARRRAAGRPRGRRPRGRHRRRGARPARRSRSTTWAWPGAPATQFDASWDRGQTFYVPARRRPGHRRLGPGRAGHARRRPAPAHHPARTSATARAAPAASSSPTRRSCSWWTSSASGSRGRPEVGCPESGSSREASVKFGVFYELSVPRPWTHEAERQVYLNALEQVRLADELGFHSVWAVEHHFLEEYSHCSAPELFLTACAMQTKNIRVGHGIVDLRPAVQPPDPRRRARRRARHPVGRPPRVRHRPVGHVDRARRLPRRPRRHQEDVGRVRAHHPADVDEGALRLRGRVLLDAHPRRAAQAVPEAAPADVGRGVVARHRVRRRRPRHGRPRRELHDVQGAGAAGRGVPPPHPELRRRPARSSTTSWPRPTSCSATRTPRPAWRPAAA